MTPTLVKFKKKKNQLVGRPLRVSSNELGRKDIMNNRSVSATLTLNPKKECTLCNRNKFKDLYLALFIYC
jgi:hypothetical protein